MNAKSKSPFSGITRKILLAVVLVAGVLVIFSGVLFDVGKGISVQARQQSAASVNAIAPGVSQSFHTLEARSRNNNPAYVTGLGITLSGKKYNGIPAYAIGLGITLSAKPQSGIHTFASGLGTQAANDQCDIPAYATGLGVTLPEKCYVQMP